MNKTAVIDASFVLAFLLPDETECAADNIFALYSRGEYGLISTALLPFEVLNGLKSAVARRRLASEIVERLMRDFLDLRIPLYDIDFASAWQIANQHGLSMYDAAYVELARSTAYPLLTLDERLAAVNNQI